MKSFLERVKYIAFDADDTLWVNEPYFREAEAEYCRVLERFAQPKEIIDTLYQTELKNLAPYGYGAKAFTISLMETAIGFSNRYSSGSCSASSGGVGKVASCGGAPLTPDEMSQVIKIGTSLINVPMILGRHLTVVGKPLAFNQLHPERQRVIISEMIIGPLPKIGMWPGNDLHHVLRNDTAFRLSGPDEITNR